MRAIIPRFFAHHPLASWVLLAGCVAWGLAGYRALPRRKDPAVVVPVGAVLCPWPGHYAAEVERELTAMLERTAALDARVSSIQSVTRDNAALLRVIVDERIDRPQVVFDAMEVRLRNLSLPSAAGPIEVLHDVGDTAALLLGVVSSVDEHGRPAHDAAEMDILSAQVAAALERSAGVASVRRVGIAEERVFVDLDVGSLEETGLSARALVESMPAQAMSLSGGPPPNNMATFRNEEELAALPLGLTPRGPVTLGQVARVRRAREDPPQTPVFLSLRGEKGTWRRAPAVVLDVQRSLDIGITAFGVAVDEALAQAQRDVPPTVRLERLSDQVQQEEESIGRFMRSLLDAIVLVVLVALAGFLSLRVAVLLACSIPLTLTITFGLLHLLGIDLQQVTTASLILALGLLVDDPVVAADAIQAELDAGRPLDEAAWRGPARLSRAILFATITNVVAYLPLLLLTGNTGRFIYSLPIVLTCSLIASRLVSMSFVPFLGRLLLRASGSPGKQRIVWRWFNPRAFYLRTGAWALAHRRPLLVAMLVLLVPGGFLVRAIPTQFFPRDLEHLSYLDLWLPEGGGEPATLAAAERAEEVVAECVARVSPARPALRSMTTFVGRGAPRFWFAMDPQPPQSRYAQIVLVAPDDRDTERFADPLQDALTDRVREALIDVRRLEIGRPIGVPVQIRVSGDDLEALRDAAGGVARILRAVPSARRVRTDWPALTDEPRSRGDLDPRLAAAVERGGVPLGLVNDGARPVQVLVRVTPEDLRRLSAEFPSRGDRWPRSILRRNQRRTVTVSAFPSAHAIASEVLAAARPQLDAYAATLPAGLRLEIGGEHEEQMQAFGELGIVLAVSVVLIFLALAMQMRSAIKPLLVFAAVPFGAVGALGGLWLMGQPFGFMAFLGLASLVGVIVSHVIVLFDGIEDAREHRVPLDQALLDSGLARLRPVLVTVGATVFGLVPLVARGGPLWQPLCHIQIGGLILATVVTLLLVPLLYAVAVRDLRLIRWEPRQPGRLP